MTDRENPPLHVVKPPPRRRPDDGLRLVDRVWPDAEAGQRAWAMRQAVLAKQRTDETSASELVDLAEQLVAWVLYGDMPEGS